MGACSVFYTIMLGNQLCFLFIKRITTYNRKFSKQRVIVYCCIHDLNKCHNLCIHLSTVSKHQFLNFF